jgi:hypothetical protein
MLGIGSNGRSVGTAYCPRSEEKLKEWIKRICKDVGYPSVLIWSEIDLIVQKG